MGSIQAAIDLILKLSAEGIATAVVDIDRLSPDDAGRLAGVFLHDRKVAGAIDPFAAMLRAVAERRSVGAWDVMAPAGDRRAEVTAIEGAGAGGAVDAPAGLPPAGIPLAEADRFLRALPAEHPECLACDRFPLCEGYGARMGSCETWRAVTGRILAAARELGMLGRSLAAEEHAEGAEGAEGAGKGPEDGPGSEAEVTAPGS